MSIEPPAGSLTETHDELFAKLPFAMMPLHQMSAANEPIILYTGEMELTWGNDTLHGDGDVCWEWLPRPRVRFSFSPSEQIAALAFRFKLTNGELRLSDGRVLEVAITSLNDIASGDVVEAEFGAATGIHRIVFHVPNFRPFLGDVIRHQDGHAWRGRANIEADGWRITLDELRDTHKPIMEQLKGLGGYAVTHVGVLERLDQTSFASDAAASILEPLFWFLSFCRGSWTGPILPQGFDALGNVVWTKWSSLKIERWRSGPNWFNDDATDGLTNGFPGFLRRWQDDVWSEPVEHAIHWYVESCMSSGAIEGSIILEQAAFELLAWTLLVEDRHVVSFDGFEKLPAADKMRLLFSTCGIPLEIPTSLKELTASAGRLNWVDGPQSIAELRNALIHSHPKKRKRTLADGTGPRWEAWLLGLWFLELSLLRLFNFDGRYSCRLIRGVYKGHEVRPVPWA